MPATIVQKLRIKEGCGLFTVNAPKDFLVKLGTLPKGVTITNAKNNFQQVHWFVENKQQMEKELPKVISLVKGDVLCWIYYPKGSSNKQTDLTRDKGWDALLAHDMQWLSLISFDDTWSAFGFRAKTEADRKKEAAPKERLVFQYVDAATKTVRLPRDLEVALQKEKKLLDYFNSLAFTHKKEYIEWIVEAKKDETRMTRISGTIERLKKGWKNPVGR